MTAWTEALFENSYDVTVVADIDGTVSFVTPSITRVLGYTTEEILGRSGFDFLHLDDLPEALATQAESIDGVAVNPTLEIRAHHKDGSIRWLELVLTNRFSDPAIHGLVANIRDVTRRKAVEESLASVNAELEQRNRELAEAVALKDKFVATVNHEIRAPLTLVIGMAQTLRWAWKDLSDEEKMSFLSKIEHRGQQLGAIIDDLVVLGRAEREGPAEAVVCEVEVAIREAMEATVGEEGAELRCPPGLVARADPQHLNQILVNYLTNAVRYGAPPLVVEAHGDGDWVEIRVRDHGPGVAPEFVGELFEPFTRGRGARDTVAEGTGLGLAIVQELAHADGGAAWYEDNRPNGSCFAVRLPA